MEEVIVKDMEFKQKLTELINESGLPAFILKPTFKDVFEQLNILEKQQYQEALNTSNKKRRQKNDLER